MQIYKANETPQPQHQHQSPTTTANKRTNDFSGKVAGWSGALPTTLEFLGIREATIQCLTVRKIAGVDSYTHQNDKVKGEAVGNLDRLLEWNTIHIGTDTTVQVHGVPWWWKPLLTQHQIWVQEGKRGSRICSNATHNTHPNDIPSPPTHTTCPPPHIISCCPLEPVRCIMSHRYLGNYLISLDDMDPPLTRLSWAYAICSAVRMWPRVSCLHSRVHQH